MLPGPARGFACLLLYVPVAAAPSTAPRTGAVVGPDSNLDSGSVKIGILTHEPAAVGSAPDRSAVGTRMKNHPLLLIVPALLSSGGILGTAAEREDLLAFAAEPLRFESFCFTGDRFPACEFEHPGRVAKLVGPYTLAVTWYDGQGNVVTAPGKGPGRYAAVVEVRRPGRVSKRFFTLYHLLGKAPVKARATGAALTLPRGSGIEPETQRGEDVDELTSQVVSAAMRR